MAAVRRDEIGPQGAGTLVPLGRIINSEMLLKLPSYQREYEWDYRRWHDLFHLIRRNFMEEKDLFFNAVFFFKVNGGFEIVDGQQRLTTFAILILALQRLTNVGEDERYNNIVRNDQYLLQQLQDDSGRQPLSRIIKNAFDTFVRFLTEEFGEGNLDSFSNILEFVKTRCKVAWISIGVRNANEQSSRLTNADIPLQIFRMSNQFMPREFDHLTHLKAEIHTRVECNDGWASTNMFKRANLGSMNNAFEHITSRLRDASREDAAVLNALGGKVIAMAEWFLRSHDPIIWHTRDDQHHALITREGRTLTDVRRRNFQLHFERFNDGNNAHVQDRMRNLDALDRLRHDLWRCSGRDFISTLVSIYCRVYTDDKFLHSQLEALYGYLEVIANFVADTHDPSTMLVDTAAPGGDRMSIRAMNARVSIKLLLCRWHACESSKRLFQGWDKIMFLLWTEKFRKANNETHLRNLRYLEHFILWVNITEKAEHIMMLQHHVLLTLSEARSENAEQILQSIFFLDEDRRNEIHEFLNRENVATQRKSKACLIHILSGASYNSAVFDDDSFVTVQNERAMLRNPPYATNRHTHEFTLEHIAPRTTRAGTPSYLSQKHINKIGNITLLPQRLNSILNNRDHFGKSVLFLLREEADRDNPSLRHSRQIFLLDRHINITSPEDFDFDHEGEMRNFCKAGGTDYFFLEDDEERNHMDPVQVRERVYRWRNPSDYQNQTIPQRKGWTRDHLRARTDYIFDLIHLQEDAEPDRLERMIAAMQSHERTQVVPRNVRAKNALNLGRLYFELHHDAASSHLDADIRSTSNDLTSNLQDVCSKLSEDFPIVPSQEHRKGVWKDVAPDGMPRIHAELFRIFRYESARHLCSLSRRHLYHRFFFVQSSSNEAQTQPSVPILSANGIYHHHRDGMEDVHANVELRVVYMGGHHPIQLRIIYDGDTLRQTSFITRLYHEDDVTVVKSRATNYIRKYLTLQSEGLEWMGDYDGLVDISNNERWGVVMGRLQDQLQPQPRIHSQEGDEAVDATPVEEDNNDSNDAILFTAHAYYDHRQREDIVMDLLVCVYLTQQNRPRMSIHDGGESTLNQSQFVQKYPPGANSSHCVKRYLRLRSDDLQWKDDVALFDIEDDDSWGDVWQRLQNLRHGASGEEEGRSGEMERTPPRKRKRKAADGGENEAGSRSTGRKMWSNEEKTILREVMQANVGKSTAEIARLASAAGILRNADPIRQMIMRMRRRTP